MLHLDTTAIKVLLKHQNRMNYLRIEPKLVGVKMFKATPH